MPLSTCLITGDWPLPDGQIATGHVIIEPVGEATAPGAIVPVVPVTVPLVNGAISKLFTANTEATALQYRVTEYIDGARPPAPSYVITPTGAGVDLSSGPRSATGTVSLYVLASTVGQSGGPAGPLDVNGKIPIGQLLSNGTLAWRLAETYAGLSNPAAIVPWPANDPNNSITLPAGIYQNYLFVCSELIIPNNNTKLINCDIVCGNANYGVRLDANTGQEVGRYLEHCRVNALGVAFSGAGFTARLCEVYNNGDDSARLGRSHAEATVFELCHFHDFRPQTGAHADGVQIVTTPAADVVIWGCSIGMTTAAGYTMPVGAGYTAAVFVDTSDVPIAGGDPEPTRTGSIWVDSCRLVSADNYSLVVAGPNVDVRNCTLLPGTTAIESLNGNTVTGANNVDVNGVPIIDTDIHGDPRSRYLTVGDPRQAGGGALKAVRSAYITSGNITLTNTAGAWQVVHQANAAPVEIDLPAVVNDWVEVGVDDMRTGTDAVDIAVVVGSTLVRFLASGNAVAAHDGDTGWYASGGGPFFLNSTPRGFDVTSNDLDNGVVRFCLVSNGNGTSVIEASSTDTWYWCAKNFGPHG